MELGTMTAAWPSRNGQFLVIRREEPIASGAVRHVLSRHAIDTFGGLSITAVHERTGRIVGAILGNAIDLDRGLLSVATQVNDNIDNNTADSWVERNIYSLTGSFIFVLDIPHCSRIYLDADGTKSLVYDRSRKVAGATAMTLLDPHEYSNRLQTELHRKLGVSQAGWFPAGLTAHKGIYRLTCNHYLDLDSWAEHRHWPSEPIAMSTDPMTTFDDVLVRIRRTVEVLQRSGTVKIALTAGTDSRFVLSALRPIASAVQAVTVAAPSGGLDVHTARHLARELNLRHEVLPYRIATQAQTLGWQVRAGHCISGANMTMHPSVYPLRGSYFLGGLGGEVGRGFLWLGADDQTPIDASGITARLKLPREPQVVQAVARWLEPIDSFDTLLKLDLAYLELRMSSWAFSDSYANPVETELHPMISRANFAAMLSIPPEMRRDGRVFRDAISRSWPELLSIPINRYGNWRDFTKRIKDVAADPRRAARKLRQIALRYRKAF